MHYLLGNTKLNFKISLEISKTELLYFMSTKKWLDSDLKIELHGKVSKKQTQSSS